MVTRGLPLGIDFSGGTLVIVGVRQQGVTEDDVRDAVAPLPGDEVVQRYGSADERRFLIRLPLAQVAEPGTSLEAGAQQVTQALQAAHLPAFQIVDRELVSAAIGEDLQRRGIYATVASIGGDHDLHRRPFSILLCDRRDRGHAPRHPGDAGVPLTSPGTTCR